MTPEPPTPPVRRNRPDASFRRRALGLPAEAADAPAPAPRPAHRESFRSALSRIPDLERTGDPSPGPTDLPPADPSPPSAATGPADGAAAAEAAGTLGAPSTGEVPVAAVRTNTSESSPPPEVGLVDPPAGRRTRTSPPPPAPWWRRVAFAVVLLSLVAAIPILGRTGYRIITDSTDGRLASGGARPGEPGYEELVTPSPTALVIQRDAATGRLANLTFLSLAGESGGTVIFLPLETALTVPGFGFDRLRTTYSLSVEAGVPLGETERFLADQAAGVVNAGIDQIISLDAAGWERLVTPVAPVSLDNPDPLVLDGTELPTGPVELGAGQIGSYLAAAREGEDDANRFFRQEGLWRAWLAAVADSPRADAVPGESTAGMGLFARRLAEGPVTYASLPGAFEEGPEPMFIPDGNAVAALIADAVPAPTAAYPGSRVAVRLLNGVAAAEIPTEITKQVVTFRGSVDIVGNGPSFGTAKTDIVYGDPAQKPFAELLRAGLGATGEVRQDPAAPDNIGVTVILGRDLLGDQRATTTAPGGTDAAPSTTALTGGP